MEDLVPRLWQPAPRHAKGMRAFPKRPQVHPYRAPAIPPSDKRTSALPSGCSHRVLGSGGGRGGGRGKKGRKRPGENRGFPYICSSRTVLPRFEFHSPRPMKDSSIARLGDRVHTKPRVGGLEIRHEKRGSNPGSLGTSLVLQL